MFWILLLLAALGVVFTKLGAISVWLSVFKAMTLVLVAVMMATGIYTAWRIYRAGRSRPRSIASRQAGS